MESSPTVNGLSGLIARSDIQDHFPFLTRKALAELAYKQEGPPYIKALGQAFYRPCDIEAWLMSKMVLPSQKSRSSDTVTERKATTDTQPIKRGRGRPRKGETRSRKTA